MLEIPTQGPFKSDDCVRSSERCVLGGVLWKSRARAAPKTTGWQRQSSVKFISSCQPCQFHCHLVCTAAYPNTYPPYFLPSLSSFYSLPVMWVTEPFHTSILHLKSQLVLEVFPNNSRACWIFHLLISYNCRSVPHLGKINYMLPCIVC